MRALLRRAAGCCLPATPARPAVSAASPEPRGARARAAATQAGWERGGEGALVEQLAVEQPDLEAVLHLVHVVDGGGHVAASRVPLHVGAHEVLGRVEHLELVRREELQLARHALQAAQHQELALRRARPRSAACSYQRQARSAAPPAAAARMCHRNRTETMAQRGGAHRSGTADLRMRTRYASRAPKQASCGRASRAGRVG